MGVVWFQNLRQIKNGCFEIVPNELSIMGNADISGDFQFDESKNIKVKHHKSGKIYKVRGFCKSGNWYCLNRTYMRLEA